MDTVQIPEQHRDIIIRALYELEHLLSAHFDGEPQALEDAAKAREALKWVKESHSDNN